MIVQSPLKKREARPNLRRVPLPDLDSPNPSSNGKRKSAQRVNRTMTRRLQDIKPWKVILGTIILGAFGFLYLTHVFATQRLLEEVQQLESQYNIIRSQHDALQLQYDRMVGPADIYNKAEAAGFINGGPADKVIVIKE